MTEDKARASRRDFLKLASTGAPVAAAVTVAGGTAAAAPAEEEGEGLRRTEHVRKYLEAARF